jgi:Mg2+ and Co2+ transporter CorA
MARVKKLIAVLGRLLSSKSDLVTGIKKRLVKAITSRPQGRAHKQTPEELEIAMYMTDIQGEPL